VTLYAVTERAASAQWMYPVYTTSEQIMPHRLEVPTAIFALPIDPVFLWSLLSLLERHYCVVQWTGPPQSAYLASLEVPETLEHSLMTLLSHCA
jgi:hypothetical protein